MSACSTLPTAPRQRRCCRPSSTCRPSPRRCSPSWRARRGLQLRAERIDAAPDPARLFESLFGRSANAVWLDSSLAPDGSAAAERSRFSILADDGGPFGQSVRHRSGTTRVSVGNASVRTEGPFFRWLDGVWGRP